MSNESRKIEPQLSQNLQKVENKRASRIFRNVDSSSTVQQIVWCRKIDNNDLQQTPKNKYVLSQKNLAKTSVSSLPEFSATPIPLKKKTSIPEMILESIEIPIFPNELETFNEPSTSSYEHSESKTIVEFDQPSQKDFIVGFEPIKLDAQDCVCESKISLKKATDSVYIEIDETENLDLVFVGKEEDKRAEIEIFKDIEKLSIEQIIEYSFLKNQPKISENEERENVSLNCEDIEISKNKTENEEKQPEGDLEDFKLSDKREQITIEEDQQKFDIKQQKQIFPSDNIEYEEVVSQEEILTENNLKEKHFENSKCLSNSLNSIENDEIKLETNLTNENFLQTEKLFEESLQQEIVLSQQQMSSELKQILTEEEHKSEEKNQQILLKHIPLTPKYSLTRSCSSRTLISENTETPLTSFSASFGGYKAETENFPLNIMENFEAEFPEPLIPISPPLNLDESNFFGSGFIAETEPSVSDENEFYSFKPSKKIRKLRFGIVQLRNFAIEILNQQNFGTPDLASIQLSIQVRIDSEEIFTSAAVPANSNCVFGDEFSCELPKNFYAIYFIVNELQNSQRTQRRIGRAMIKRKELRVAEPQTWVDSWLPISLTVGAAATEFIGQICLDINYEKSTNLLSLRVLDYTSWPSSSNSALSLYSTTQHTTPTAPPSNYAFDFAARNLNRKPPTSITLPNISNFSTNSQNCLAATKGQLYLRIYLSIGRSHVSPMRKLHVVERRGIDTVIFECGAIKQHLNENESEPTNCWSIPATPTLMPKSAASILSSTSSVEVNPSGREEITNFPFSGTPIVHKRRESDRPLKSAQSGAISRVGLEEPSIRLSIKVFAEANYDESSYCGLVHVPLQEDTMLPKGIALGPNWYSIKSRNNTHTSTPNIPCSDLKQKYRHCSTPSTSSSTLMTITQRPPFSPLPPISSKNSTRNINTLKTKNTNHKSPVSNTRSQPLRSAPSLASLRGLLGGSGNNSNTSQNESTINQVHSNSTFTTTKQASSQNKGNSITISSNCTTTSTSTEKIGEMRLRLWYGVDEVLPLVHYQPLYLNLINSLTVKPYSASITSLFQYLPIDMENIARPLMKIFVQTNQIRTFFRLICSQYVSSCHDVNTLFRSQSMASKIMYELMKFVGHEYLVISLKPLIDLRNITVYAELAFSRVIDSHHRCPHVLREVFAELRDVVSHYFSEREDVARLALSSFLIMRFFAAAILNPKLFGLKLESPDADVSRTLVLVSKILQRLANCVVSAHPLVTKEQWLSPVLARFSDDAHKTAMINFLDGVSARKNSSTFPNNENQAPTIAHKQPPVLLKYGQMIERRSGSDKKKRSLKNFIHQKRRYVTLTETQLSWQKVKENNDSSSATDDQKGHFSLAEITSVSPLVEAKNSFRVATPFNEVHFQANNLSEMNEWLILIQKQQRRHLMLLNRSVNDDSLARVTTSSLDSSSDNLFNPQQESKTKVIFEVDLEREMQSVHAYFLENLDTLLGWKMALEVEQKELLKKFRTVISLNCADTTKIEDSAQKIGRKSGGGSAAALPLDEMFPAANSVKEREICLEKLYETLLSTINAIKQIEKAHHSARNLTYQLFQQNAKNDSALIPLNLSRRLVDSENYLQLRSGYKRIKKSPQFPLKQHQASLTNTQKTVVAKKATEKQHGAKL